MSYQYNLVNSELITMGKSLYMEISIVLLSRSQKDFIIKLSLLSNLLKITNNIIYLSSFITESGA